LPTVGSAPVDQLRKITHPLRRTKAGTTLDCHLRRNASTGIAPTVVAIPAMSAQAAAFTPVPIPTPLAGTATAASPHDQAHATTRLDE
jgi:hypothetical protein